MKKRPRGMGREEGGGESRIWRGFISTSLSLLSSLSLSFLSLSFSLSLSLSLSLKATENRRSPFFCCCPFLHFYYTKEREKSEEDLGVRKRGVSLPPPNMWPNMMTRSVWPDTFYNSHVLPAIHSSLHQWTSLPTKKKTTKKTFVRVQCLFFLKKKEGSKHLIWQ